MTAFDKLHIYISREAPPYKKTHVCMRWKICTKGQDQIDMQIRIGENKYNAYGRFENDCIEYRGASPILESFFSILQ